MKNIKTILKVLFAIAYAMIALVVCFIFSTAITLIAFGNDLSTPSQQVHFTWLSVVMLFVLTIGTFFLWAKVNASIRNKKMTNVTPCIL